MSKIVEWPAHRYGPNGENEVFEREEDVPAGWADHPSKVIDNFDPNAGAATDGTYTPSPLASSIPASNSTSVQTGDVDAFGHAWNDAINVADKTKTNGGLWKLKPGQSRPAPAEGYPKQDFDL